MKIETLPVSVFYTQGAVLSGHLEPQVQEKKTATEGENLGMCRGTYQCHPGIMSPTRQTEKLRNPGGALDGLEKWELSQKSIASVVQKVGPRLNPDADLPNRS